MTVITVVLSIVFVNHVSASQSNEESLDQQIESAKNIKLVQKFFSFSTSYDIIIDGDVVGHIKGDFFHPFGDDLKIQTLDGQTIYAEHQQRRLLNLSLTRGGVFINKSGNIDGAIREEMFWLFEHQFKIYDQDGHHVGQSYQDPWHFFSTIYKITDSKDKPIIQGKMESLHLTKQIKVSRIKSSKKISMKQALIIITVEEAIDDANSSKDD